MGGIRGPLKLLFCVGRHDYGRHWLTSPARVASSSSILSTGRIFYPRRAPNNTNNNLAYAANDNFNYVAVRSLSSWTSVKRRDVSPHAFPSLGPFSIQIEKCCFITAPRLALIKTRSAASVPWVICVYLIHAVGHFWITSKHKYKLPLRALWVWLTAGTLFLPLPPTSRPVPYLFLRWNKHLQMNNWFYQ